MKKVTLEEWEKRYIAEEVKQFDQKNHMFIRPGWDASIHGRLEDWSFIGPVKKKNLRRVRIPWFLCRAG
ncbi:MAG: hypothetical protein MUO52_18440 [Desulfobacterales bacterium]|nr:hypothetical protein [Desulfobacterales bacterium]